MGLLKPLSPPQKEHKRKGNTDDQNAFHDTIIVTVLTIAESTVV
jgi:hypothetical protein